MDPLSVEAFDLLMRALEREYAVDPTCFTSEGYKLTFRKKANSSFMDYISVEPASYGGATYIHLKGLRKCDEPWWLAFRKRAMYDNAIKIYEKLLQPAVENIEEQMIVETVPAAKDIIAERALVGDHGNKTSNRDPKGS